MSIDGLGRGDAALGSAVELLGRAVDDVAGEFDVVILWNVRSHL